MKSSSRRTTLRQCELEASLATFGRTSRLQTRGDLLTFVTFDFRQKHGLRSPDRFPGYRKLPSACGSGH